MSRQSLDAVLLNKLVKITGKDIQYIREQICKKASKLGISTEAYLAIWAIQLGIGTTIYQRKLPEVIQMQITKGLTGNLVLPSKSLGEKSRNGEKLPQKSELSLAIEYLINDSELHDRCKDLLKARKNFDRVFREATTVVEDRIKKLSGLSKMSPLNLVGKALNPKPKKAILKVSNEAFEQEGFYSICKGLFLSFRDTTHHELSDKFQRKDAMKFCGFVDLILSRLDRAEKQEVD